MIKISIIAIGKDKDRWVTDACDHFTKLLSRYAKIEFSAIASPRNTSSLDPSEIMKREADLLIKKIGGKPYIALSDKGKKTDSSAFSRWLEKTAATSQGPLTFVIGGPHGLHQSIISKAEQIVSLSPLTFSHQLVRLVLLEQLYRGLSIINGTDYHK